jgi:glycosyltransferase involved in cell wall biosynthesis
MQVSLVIAIYNQSQFIGEIVNRGQPVYTAGVFKEVIIVDDRAADGTEGILKTLFHCWVNNDIEQPKTKQEKNCPISQKLEISFQH